MEKQVSTKKIIELSAFCEQLGCDINHEMCRNVEKELEECPECKVYYNSIEQTVELYRIAETPERVDGSMTKRLFKKLHLSVPEGDAASENV